MSFKNKLQEICQKNKTELPKYSVVDHEVDKKLNLNSWKCQVQVFNGLFTSDYFSSKKKAEIQCAELALDFYNLGEDVKGEKDFKKYIVSHPFYLEYILLFDIENCPKLLDLNYNDNIVGKYGFISKYSNHIVDRKLLETKCELYISNSNASNSADIMLTYMAGVLINKWQDCYNKFIIVSRDKFAGTLCQIIQDSGRKCYVATYKEDLEKLNILSE